MPKEPTADGRLEDMNSAFEKRRRRHSVKCAGWCLVTILPLYVLSIGPVAWATNDGIHPAYLPEKANLIYLPLMPLTKVPWVDQAFQYYTGIIWQGAPSGYTTL
jgi:hypothetical protein